MTTPVHATATNPFSPRPPSSSSSLQKFDPLRGWIIPKTDDEREKMFHDYMRVAYDRMSGRVNDRSVQDRITVEQLTRWVVSNGRRLGSHEQQLQ